MGKKNEKRSDRQIQRSQRESNVSDIGNDIVISDADHGRTFEIDSDSFEIDSIILRSLEKNSHLSVVLLPGEMSNKNEQKMQNSKNERNVNDPNRSGISIPDMTNDITTDVDCDLTISNMEAIASSEVQNIVSPSQFRIALDHEVRQIESSEEAGDQMQSEQLHQVRADSNETLNTERRYSIASLNTSGFGSQQFSGNSTDEGEGGIFKE